MRNKKNILILSVLLLCFFLVSCTSEKKIEYMDKPADDGKYYYSNQKFAFSLILPEEFIYYQTQSMEWEDYSDLIFYVPTNDSKISQDDFPGYAKPVIIRIFDKSFWEKIKNDEDFSMYQYLADTKDKVYTVKFWSNIPSDWRNRWTEDMKKEIKNSFKLGGK